MPTIFRAAQLDGAVVVPIRALLQLLKQVSLSLLRQPPALRGVDFGIYHRVDVVFYGQICRNHQTGILKMKNACA